MTKRKSNAQLKRLQKRAAQRGETYDSKTPDDDRTASTIAVVEADHQIKETKQKIEEAAVASKDTNINSTDDLKPEDAKKRTIALELKQEIKDIDGNQDMKAKERRSAKRKAEAIAVEKTGVATAQELLEWLEAVDTRPTKKRSLQNRTTPNILFIGQLTFDTTKNDIIQCVQKHLKDTENMTVGNDAITVRLLTHSKTGKSKGMAFLEINDPDPMILFSCLKLHHTYLKGRRINVERTSGGGKVSKQEKVATLRKSQVEYMKETVQAIVSEYDTSSLDDGVLALCERHNATIVHAAMERFTETDGPNKENPSAYLTALLQKLATEGIFDRSKKDGKLPGPTTFRNTLSQDRRKGRR